MAHLYEGTEDDYDDTYDGACNQYCGLQHAWMRLRVVAETQDQFNAWLAAQAAPAASTGSRGEQVFQQNTCVSCHTIRGLSGATGTVGPDLTHVGGRSTLGAPASSQTVDLGGPTRAWADAQLAPYVCDPAQGVPAD